MPAPAGRAAATDQRLPRGARILSRRDFVRVQRSKTRAPTPSFVVLSAPRREAGPTRLGIVASRKTGGSVARSRAKRLIREVFRRHKAELPDGLDVVVVARSGAPLLTYAEAEAELVRAFGRIARLAASPAPR